MTAMPWWPLSTVDRDLEREPAANLLRQAFAKHPDRFDSDEQFRLWRHWRHDPLGAAASVQAALRRLDPALYTE